MKEPYSALLIDGRHMLYRAASKMGDLGVNIDETDFMPTGAIYGFLRIALAAWDRWGTPSQTWLCVCWEGGRNFRRELFPDYKRKGKPGEKMEPDFERFLNDMSAQEDVLRELLSAAGWSQAIAKGYEADDTIGTLAKSLEAEGKRVAIYSGDHDLHQCVTNVVHVISPPAPFSKGRPEDKVWDIPTVVDHWGLPACRIPDHKGLAGDSSDNIPGAPGIGPTWAVKLLNEHATYEAMFKAAAEDPTLKGTHDGKEWKSLRMGTIVNANREIIEMSRKLATIVVEAPVEFLERKPNQSRVLDAFKTFEFKTLLRPNVLKTISVIGRT